jgi:hypothetical protein
VTALTDGVRALDLPFCAMARNVTAALLATLGVGLAAWAALDWVAYGGFTISMIWR